MAWLLALLMMLPLSLATLSDETAVAADPRPTKTFAAGSYIIDSSWMGTSTTGVQPKPEGLQPYGLLYQLLTSARVPVYWIIADGKTGQVQTAPSRTNLPPDITTTVRSPYNTTAAPVTKSYYSGAFVIPAEFMTDSVLTSLISAAALTAVRVDKSTAAFTAPYFEKLTYWPRATLDAQNGSIAAGFYTNAKIPANTQLSYNYKLPSQLGPCDDLYVMPHADPTWATHQRLLSWNRDEKGYIWAGCHAVSVLENIADPTVPNRPALNFLSTEGTLDYGAHNDASPPYYYGSLTGTSGLSYTTPGTTIADRSDPVVQFIGATELAQQNGSESIYMPNPESKYPALTGVSRWRDGVRYIAWDPTQADVPLNSPGVAVAAIYGRAFDDPNRGMVMYEASHSINKGTVGDTPAQRAFFNFVLLSGADNAPHVVMDTSQVNDSTPSGATVPVSATIELGSGSPNYQYTWQDTCGGTFATKTGSSPGGTISTTWTAPSVSSATPCQVRLVVVDACLRTVFDADTTTVMPIADVSITKTADKTATAIGGQVTYTLSVTNTGPAPATGVVVTDTLPAGLTYASATPTPTTVSGQVLTWELGSVAVGQVRTIQVTATAAAAAAGTTVVNNVEVTATTPDPDLTNNSAHASTRVVNSGIQITKTATPLIVPNGGGSVTYEYTVRNTGDNPLSNVVVTDNPTCTVTGPTGDLNGDGLLNEPYLGVDREIWRYSCTKTVTSTTGDVAVAFDGSPGKAIDGDTFTKQNVVKVTAKDAAGLTVSGVAWATVTVSNPAISVTKALEPAGQLPAPGKDATFRITVTNTGNVPLTDVSTTDGWPGTCSVATIPTLAAGESYDVLCSATTPTSPTLTTVASDSFDAISWTGGTGWLAGWTAGTNITVVSGSALPGGTANGNVVQHAGNQTSLTRRVDLSGAASASLNFRYFRSAGFNDTPANLYVEASKDGGTTWSTPVLATITGTGSNTVDTAWTQVSVNISSYASANTAIRFRAAADFKDDQLYLDNVEIIKGTVVNTVTATGTDPFGTTKTATDTEPVMPGTPGLSISKTASKAGPLREGDTMYYEVKVTNTGTTNQTGVTITDALPAGLSLDGSVTVDKPEFTLTATDGFGTSGATTRSYSTGSGWASEWTEIGETTNPADNNIRIDTTTANGNPAPSLWFNPGDGRGVQRTVNLAAASTATISFDCRRENFDGGDTLTVYVGTQIVKTFPNGTDEGCPVSTTAWGNTLLPVDSTQLIDGQIVKIVVNGNKDFWIDNVTITGTTPATGVTAGDPPTLTSVGGPYNLNPTDVLTFTIPVTVTGAPADGYQFSNLASVTSTQQTAPVSAAVSTPYLDPSVEITKTAIETWANAANNVVKYQFEVRNTGNSDLTFVSISDPLCDAGTLSARTGDLNSDDVLQVGEIWRYSCTNTVSSPYGETNPDPYPDAPDDVPNTVTATFTDTAGGTVTDDATANVKVLHPSIEITADPTNSTILSGGTVSYTYTLDNTGDVAITNPAVKASNCTSLTYTGGDTNNDGILDIAETWTYTCTTAPLTDDVTGATVTATGNALIFGTPVEDNAPVAVNVDVINPAIVVDKKVYDSSTTTAAQAVDAPAETPLTVGKTNDIMYLYTVTNPGDVPLAVTLTDDGTTTPPVPVDADNDGFNNGDLDKDGLLDPGEVWLYTYDAGLLDGGYSGTVTTAVQAVGAYSITVGDTTLAGTVSDSDSTNVRVLTPELILLKQVDSDYVGLGSDVTYHYTVRNTGQTWFAPSSLGTPVDDKCAPMVPVPFAAPADADGDGRLDPGEELYFTCTTPMNALEDGTTSYALLNTFTLGQSTDYLGNKYTPGPAVAQVFVLNPTFTVVKTADTAIAEPGDDILGEPGQPVSYAIDISHSITAPFGDFRDSINAVLLTVQDPVCTAGTLAYASGDADADGYLNPGETHRYTCTLDELGEEGPTVNTVTVTGLVVERALDENGQPIQPNDGLGPREDTAQATVTPLGKVVTVYKMGTNCDVGLPTCEMTIAGTEFTIYAADPTGPDPGTGDVLTPVAGSTSTFTTTNLIVNRDYWLVESKAPAGFQLLAQPIKFHLTTAQITLDPASASPLITADGFRISVTDVPAADLPLVGGDGSLPHLLVGLLLIGSAFAAYVRSVRRSRGRRWSL
ncbi:hypothetical protein BCR15_11505 [Tessaracoccus lapidicaptus]|uniref:DUF11 domain-containing protein n=1 Tax=Tessaracoccus lapidicaptus TaxID=1427523 RepID=A0A1C0AS41_9ACTN|nr:SpaA isopeptide-forming pilin-related protein [Tessaracoccus lapidicaptus]OCL37089.1 hypothetical protein BCR15_11505 [Tessaracoccus lapidicaptus]